jgi:hypothetical protein
MSLRRVKLLSGEEKVVMSVIPASRPIIQLIPFFNGMTDAFVT